MNADILDEASELEQKVRDAAIEEARYQAAKPKVIYEGCVWCGDPSGGKKFCCAECRDDSERLSRALA